MRQRSLCLQRGSNHPTKDYVLFFSLARSSLIQAWHHRHIDARIDSLPLVLLYCELCNALDYLRHNLNQRNRARILSDFVQICIGIIWETAQRLVLVSTLDSLLWRARHPRPRMRRVVKNSKSHALISFMRRKLAQQPQLSISFPAERELVNERAAAAAIIRDND